eukprot:TRINITY_DN82985_c0_g1_i1.p1 TRINITY_DN82985_c0_g1~~TRINITY_DN82985_c0_g1_i1.p1  ORF type:complete len:481 (-),score=92.01 TRINITY_DN82985_c0_g1_i1:236-1678(-)
MVVKTYTRSTGAKSGAESYLIPPAIMIALVPCLGAQTVLKIIAAMFVLQLLAMDKMDRNQLWYSVMSQKLGPSVMRNASIGFAECVRPGGKPTEDHCLNLYSLPGPVTSLIFLLPMLLMLMLNPLLAIVRVCYPEHKYGVPKSLLELAYFFIRHPLAIQGEGPSNGDGLAGMNASESVAYPLTPMHLEQGPKDKVYWLEDGEGKPRFRDMFHDKLFCHRFFESHGAAHPALVCEVFRHERREIALEPDQAPKKLVWKPRYSTMGLGVEHFTETGWEGMDNGKDWAPSSVPYLVEEFLQSTEYPAAEWYRMTSLWDWEEAEPKFGYAWRTRNALGDPRVQTDILGWGKENTTCYGAYCVATKYEPFVGPKDKGMSVDPRTGEKKPLDEKVERALTKAIELQRKMHKNLGKELHSIGWDVMIVGDTPYFLEFNINNGFFVGDHSMQELWQMADYYTKNFLARLPSQLVNFDPHASGGKKKTR